MTMMILPPPPPAAARDVLTQRSNECRRSCWPAVRPSPQNKPETKMPACTPTSRHNNNTTNNSNTINSTPGREDTTTVLPRTRVPRTSEAAVMQRRRATASLLQPRVGDGGRWRRQGVFIRRHLGTGAVTEHRHPTHNAVDGVSCSR